jgi:uncharacterized membrane protein YebE (DUF533 family)
MANWRKVAISALLADGVIDDTEVRVLKRELYEDGQIDKEEVEFLIELRNQAQKKGKRALSSTFENFFFKAIQDNVLQDGSIDAEEATWLRKMLFADNKIDEGEKKFLKKLKSSAKSTSPAFDRLYKECVGK